MIQSLCLYITKKLEFYIFTFAWKSLNLSLKWKCRDPYKQNDFVLQTLGNAEELKILLKHLNIFIFILEKWIKVHGTP